MRRFGRLSDYERSIVFYSEGKDDWVHLSPIVKHLLCDHDKTICYLSSSTDDPGLHQEDTRIIPFLIGNGTVRTIIFRIMRAKVIVMTLQDLGVYNIKKSAYPAHYIYVHHSAASSHMVYRKDAFTHFDTIFCVGPHHIEETRKAEFLYNTAAKVLVEHGSGRIDAIAQEASDQPPSEIDGLPKIVIAPSWSGDSGTGMLESLGYRLIEPFLAEGFDVTLRPHSLTRKHFPKLVHDLVERYSKNALFKYDDDMTSSTALVNSNLLVSDWSGVTFDYAFGRLRPVLYIDTPRKVNNPEYERLDIAPLEVRIRDEIGAIVAPENIEQAGGIARRLIENASEIRNNIAASRSKWLYNLGASGARGADYIAELLDRTNTE
jgi:hypothetical protein